MAAEKILNILWLQGARKTHFSVFGIIKATFSTHHNHCNVLVSSQPKASKFSQKLQRRCTLLASFLQWEGHPRRLGYGQVRLPIGEK